MVADEIATPTTDGKYEINPDSIGEIVADKGYFSGETLKNLSEMSVRTYIAEPKQRRRHWKDKEDQQSEVSSNRRRINAERGKSLQRKRGERLERPFAHQYGRGRMRCLHVRGLENMRKRTLMMAAGFNLALLMHKLLGNGSPKGLSDWQKYAFLVILRGIIQISVSCAFQYGANTMMDGAITTIISQDPLV